jgi:hypothetical protein
MFYLYDLPFKKMEKLLKIISNIIVEAKATKIISLFSFDWMRYLLTLYWISIEDESIQSDFSR